jgi:hypothetical protein
VTFSPNNVVDNPSITISAPGTYTINLQAVNNVSTSVETKTIVVNDCRPVPNFTMNRIVVHMCDPRERDSVGTKNLTQLNSGVPGVNSYTWSVQPNLGLKTTLTGTSATTGYSVTVNPTATPTSYTFTLRARNASGTSTLTQVVTVDQNLFSDYCESLKVGLSERNSTSMVEVYPNPARDVISISASKEGFGVTVTNVIGAVIYEEKTVRGESTSVSLGGKPRGVYFVTVTTGTEKITKKIILE